MGTDVAEASKSQQRCSDVKVHSSLCSELKKLVNTISSVIPDIESARPGSTSGVQALCSLNNLIDKAKLVIQHCAESSKLYLAITGEPTLSRCERIRSLCIQSLCQIQDMVPNLVASKVNASLNNIRAAKFIIDSAEEEAGIALLHLLQQSEITEELEFEAFQVAALRLNLTSSKGILIERRSVQKLLDKVSGTDLKKEKILRYFLHLIKKYGKNIKLESTEYKYVSTASFMDLTPTMSYASDGDNEGKVEEHTVSGGAPVDMPRNIEPPEEFCCLISSKIMHDPVIIASGQTYERSYIEKWFDEGHDTCPKTRRVLPHFNLIPNTTMKDLIVNWCQRNGVKVPEPSSKVNAGNFSLESFHSYSDSSLKNVCAALLDGNKGNYFFQSDNSNVSLISSDASYISDSSSFKGSEVIKNNCGHLFSWSNDYQKYQSFSKFNHDIYMRFFYNLLELPVNEQKNALENLKTILESDETSYAMLYNGFPEALLVFLKNAYDLSNVYAQKTGSQLLLTYICRIRVEASSLSEDASQLLISFLDPEITADALIILKKLAHHPTYKSNILASVVVSSIVKILKSNNAELLEVCLQILADFSTDEDLKAHIMSCSCITNLASFVTDGRGRLAKFCLQVMRNISETEGGSGLIAKASGSVASIVELLDTGNDEEKEHAVAILHSICSHSLENCLLVMDEGVIPALVGTSINGNEKGKEISLKLLHLLRNVRTDGSVDSCNNLESKPESIENEVEHSEEELPPPKSHGLIGRGFRFFSKPRSTTHV